MISRGHPPAAVWEYTPRQVRAFVFIANYRETIEQATGIENEAFANRGDPKKIKQTTKKMKGM